MAASPRHDARSGSGAATAYARIRRSILTGRLAPGRELREAQLVDETGLGRTPVREALGRLVVEGLVEVRPRQGYRVTEVTLDSVRDLFEMRLMLEPAAVALAIERGTDAQLEELRELASRTYDARDTASYGRFLADNRDLHVRIAEVSGNVRLARTLGAVLDELQRLFYVTLQGAEAVEQLHEHAALFDAIVERDTAQARAIVEEQIAGSRRHFLDRVGRGARSPDGASGGIVLVAQS